MGFQSLLHSPFLSTYIEYKYLLALSNPIVDKKSGHYSACDKDSLTNFLLLCLKICSSWSYLRLQATIQKKTYIVEMEAVCNKDSLNPSTFVAKVFPYQWPAYISSCTGTSTLFCRHIGWKWEAAKAKAIVRMWGAMMQRAGVLGTNWFKITSRRWALTVSLSGLVLSLTRLG